MNRSDLITLGEPLAALIGVEPEPFRFGSRLELQVAGAELNVAVAAARLGHRVLFLGCVGADRLGRLAGRELAAEGVEARLRSVADAPTGLLLRDLSAGTTTEVDYRRAGSAGAQLGPADVTSAAGSFGGARFLHVTGITPALSDSCRAAVEAALRVARQHDLPVSFDVNYRAKLWGRERAASVLAPLVEGADLVFGSADELALVAEGAEPRAAAQRLLEAGARAVVLKQEAGGATALTPDGEIHEPAEEVRAPVDPVGAGDAFAAGVLSGLIDDLPVAEALRRGHACGARVLVTRGDLPGLPRRDELDSAPGTAR